MHIITPGTQKRGISIRKKNNMHAENFPRTELNADEGNIASSHSEKEEDEVTSGI